MKPVNYIVGASVVILGIVASLTLDRQPTRQEQLKFDSAVLASLQDGTYSKARAKRKDLNLEKAIWDGTYNKNDY